MKYLRFVLLPFIFFCAAGLSSGQKSHRDSGIDLLKAGKDKEAAKLFRKAVKQDQYSNDAEVWNFLGLAQFNSGGFRDAVESLEKATKLDPKSGIYHANLANAYRAVGRIPEAKRSIQKAVELDPTSPGTFFLRAVLYLYDKQFDEAVADTGKSIRLDPNFAAAYSLKADILISQIGNKISFGSKLKDELPLLRAAADILQSCIDKCTPNPIAAVQRERFTTLNRFRDYFDQGGSTGLASAGDPNIVPLKVLKKEPAVYTDAGRRAMIRGTVSVSALCEADGRIRYVLVTSGLGFGLDEKAIEAARGIKFIPATRNGVPVDRVIHLEYSFDIY